MAQFNAYPRGYMWEVPNTEDVHGRVVEKPYHPEVNALINLWRAPGISPNAWHLRGAAIACAARVFGDFNKWLMLQLNVNDRVFDLNLRFLEDTVQYIRTGHRSTSVENWLMLLMDNHGPQEGIASVARGRSSISVSPGEFKNFIADWCQWPDGFDDMVCTMHVLFGASRSPVKPKAIFV